MTSFTGNRTNVGIAVVCIAQFVVVLDATIVTTALPAIRPALGFTAAGLPWVITAYTLVFGGTLITGGRVADVSGPRRVFAAGLVVFGLGSAGCATAVGPGVLVAMRAVQGCGAALLSPAALALLTQLTPEVSERRRAVGWWTAAAATGGASGWMLGGLLTEFFGWRTVFWVNLPLVVIALRLAARVLPASRPGQRRSLDLPGATLATGALALLVYGLTGLGAHGPGRPGPWIPLLLALVLGGLFTLRVRRAADPLVPAGLLRSRVVAGSNLAAMALTATTTPAMYLSTLYVRQTLGLSAARASLLFPVFNLAVVAGSLAGPGLLNRLGARRTVLIGFTGIAAGSVVCATFPGAGMPIAQVVSAFALMGGGLGAASVASTHSGTESAPPRWRGVASGVLNSSAQIGTSVGLAILTPLAAAAGSATMTGYRSGFTGTAVLAVVAVSVSVLLPGPRSDRPVRPGDELPARR